MRRKTEQGAAAVRWAARRTKRPVELTAEEYARIRQQQEAERQANNARIEAALASK